MQCNRRVAIPPRKAGISRFKRENINKDVLKSCKLQSRLEKQAFQVKYRGNYQLSNIIEDYIMLQSRLEKQAFQVKPSRNEDFILEVNHPVRKDVKYRVYDYKYRWLLVEEMQPNQELQSRLEKQAFQDEV